MLRIFSYSPKKLRPSLKKLYAHLNAIAGHHYNHFLPKRLIRAKEDQPNFSPSFALQACRYQLVKMPRQFKQKPNVLFVSYCKNYKVSGHVIHYLKHLKQQGLQIILLAAVDHFNPQKTLQNLPNDLLDGLMVRENIGYDFAAWSHLLQCQKDLWQSSLLLFLNDSIYGPFDAKNFQNILQKIKKSPADYIAATESYDVKHHFQSFFFALKNKALRSAQCQHFWQNVTNYFHKHHVICSYEIELLQQLKACHLRTEVLFPIANPYGNPSIFQWQQLIDRGFPFMKACLAYSFIEDANNQYEWKNFLMKKNYDIQMIVEHLRDLQIDLESVF